LPDAILGRIRGSFSVGAPPAAAARVSLPALGARVSLLALVGCGLWLAGAAAGDDYIVDTASAPEPSWAHGPLRGLLPALSDTSFSILLIGFVVAYAAVVAGAETLPSRWLIGGVCLLVVAFAVAPPLLSSDVFGYVAYARLAVSHGLNPYVYGPIAAPRDAVLPLVYWQRLSTPYGPVFTLASYGVGATSLPVAVWTLKAVMGATALAAIALVRRAAELLGRPPARAVALVAANPLLLLFAIGGAHNDIAVMAVLLIAVVLVTTEHQVSAGATLVAAAALKLTGGLLLPFAVLGSRHRSRLLIGIAAAAAAVGAVTLAAFGAHVFDTIAAISTGQQFNADYSGPDLVGRALGTGITTTVRVLCALFGAAILAISLRSVLRGGDWLAGAGWTALAAILIVPSFVPWYVAWLLPLAALARSRWLAPVTIALTAAVAVTHLPVLGFPTYI
jgi:alpha-1,6-mannosyltransferase